jgi:hypothetical protein
LVGGQRRVPTKEERPNCGNSAGRGGVKLTKSIVVQEPNSRREHWRAQHQQSLLVDVPISYYKLRASTTTSNTSATCIQLYTPSAAAAKPKQQSSTRLRCPSTRELWQCSWDGMWRCRPWLLQQPRGPLAQLPLVKLWRIFGRRWRRWLRCGRGRAAQHWANDMAAGNVMVRGGLASATEKTSWRWRARVVKMACICCTWRMRECLANISRVGVWAWSGPS